MVQGAVQGTWYREPGATGTVQCMVQCKVQCRVQCMEQWGGGGDPLPWDWVLPFQAVGGGGGVGGWGGLGGLGGGNWFWEIRQPGWFNQ